MLTTITTVGYGDYLPKNVYEMGALSVIMLLCVAFFAYIMGAFNGAISEYNAITSIDDQMSGLNIWLD
jgi:hypothetical protein